MVRGTLSGRARARVRSAPGQPTTRAPRRPSHCPRTRGTSSQHWWSDTTASSAGAGASSSIPSEPTTSRGTTATGPSRNAWSRRASPMRRSSYASARTARKRSPGPSMEPQQSCPTSTTAKQYLQEQDIEPDYRITCIFVDKRFRQHGLVTVALEGALALIAQAGGGVVEGYPHIPGERRLSSSFLYNGTKAVYERAGFDFIRPKGLKNTVMRRSVAPSHT